MKKDQGENSNKDDELVQLDGPVDEKGPRSRNRPSSRNSKHESSQNKPKTKPRRGSTDNSSKQSEKKKSQKDAQPGAKQDRGIESKDSDKSKHTKRPEDKPMRKNLVNKHSKTVRDMPTESSNNEQSQHRIKDQSKGMRYKNIFIPSLSEIKSRKSERFNEAFKIRKKGAAKSKKGMD